MVVTVKNPILEDLIPSPDGIITDFFTTRKYESGTMSVWLNEIRLIKDLDDGFEDPGGKLVRMKEAPLVGDSLQGEYEPK